MGELKLHNRPVGGYASKKEARRAAELRTLKERTRELDELQNQVQELEAGDGPAEWPLGSAATTEAAAGAKGGGEDGA